MAPQEQFLLFSTIFCNLILDFCVITRTRFSLRDKRLVEITEVEISRVDCITVSRAFHTVKFELDNERHFHARITINMVYFNGNSLEPLIRKSTISKVL